MSAAAVALARHIAAASLAPRAASLKSKTSPSFASSSCCNVTTSAFALSFSAAISAISSSSSVCDRNDSSACAARAIADAICTLSDVAFSFASHACLFFCSSSTSAEVALFSQCEMVSFAMAVSSTSSLISRDF